MKKNVKILLGLVLLCFCVSCIFFLINFFNSVNPSNPFENSYKDIKGYTVSKIFFDSALSDNRNKQVIYRDVEQIEIPEISILFDTLNYLKNKGVKNIDPNNLELEFDPDKLDYYVNSEEKRKFKLIIPETYQKYYKNSEEIVILLNTARAEYLEYLLKKGVSKFLVDEIDMNVLPENNDSIRYFIDARLSNVTNTSSLVVEDQINYRKAQISIYDKDIYTRTEYIIKSGILGESPTTDLDKFYINARNMGLRLLMYHEMTHVLQKAYINRYLPDDGLNNKDSWMNATKTLIGASSDLFWNSLDSSEELTNRDISEESQAEGISFDAISNVYDLTDQQQMELWKHWFGRLETMKQKLNQIKSMSSTYFSNISPAEWSDLLSQYFRKSELKDSEKLSLIVEKLNNLPIYAGYLNPLLPLDSRLFWEALKE